MGEPRSTPSSGVLDRARGQCEGTIALVNSLGTTLAMWDEVTARLTESFDVIRFDQRGHGTVALPAGPTDLDDLVDDFLTVLDGFDVEQVHVAGVSLGGMVAVRATRRAPDRIRSLAVVCSAAVYDPQGWIERAAVIRRDGLTPLVPFVLDRWFAEPFRRQHTELVAAYADMLGSIDPQGYAVGCDVLATADIRADLSAVSVPTVVVGGSEDVATPPREQRFIAQAVGDAHLEILPGTAHLAPVAAPAAIAELIAANARVRNGHPGRQQIRRTAR